MHILFLTHYFPPEVNAPASRTYENTKLWVKRGHKVTVITCAPNHPNGRLYPGYQNRIRQWEEIDGINVLRVMTYLGPNRGFLKRVLNYISYMVSATMLCCLARKVDVVVSTSPQFFCGMAGYFVSRIKRRPWVLEIRDLWPESIVAVGAIKRRGIIDLLEKVESFLYLHADHIVSLTRSFKEHILKRGVSGDKISIITNGADLERFQPLPKKNPVSVEYGLDGKFVISYIGTHGMAHALETILKAADRVRSEQSIFFLLVGDGAEREKLLKMKNLLGLRNVLMLPQQPKDIMPAFLAASDACLVLLRKNGLFKTVIPSKIFEAMAMEKPVILAVEGESREIIERGECGVAVEPENPLELANAVLRLFRERNHCTNLGIKGRQFVTKNYSRHALAQSYIDVLIAVTGGK